ncbi:placenta-expressed transcript 1 protein [Nannospalax galili]|uniref:placenta-expressed transcript 1 protein n=1 Tax=Nannospalax galili TaxID=1026970 RepID=UPI0004ED1E65|nr:placenta-expressed transcript 1 protein [Nannospalax galili]
MAVFHSLLPQLGLFLCLALYSSSAFSVSYNDRCMVFDKVFTSNNSGIKAKAEVFSRNSVYTVWVPVNNKVSSVVLRAVNQHNNSVGSWDGANEDCNGTAVYHVNQSNSSFFGIHWIVPNTEDTTNTNLQIFVVDFNRTAAFSSVKVENVTPTAFTPTSKVSGTNQTTSKPTAETTTMATGKTTTMATGKTTTMTRAKTTEKPTAKTTTMAPGKTTDSTIALTTATSLAIRALSSPIACAIHILLVFLTSKLLF